MLQAWGLWMALHHRHDNQIADYTDSSGTSYKLPADNVIIHRDSVHTTDDRPVGYRSSVYNDIDILLSDHVANQDIHTSPGTSETVVANGQLIEIGWTQPVKVRALISAPVFELLGYGMAGPMYMPFPTLNMSPIFSAYRNYRNQVDLTDDYAALNPLGTESEPAFSTSPAVTWDSQGFISGFNSVEIRPEYWGYFIPPISSSLKTGISRQYTSPFICDAKNRTNSDFLSTTHNYLYLLPPYMFAPLNRTALDVVNNTVDTGNDISVFTYPPLFVDSRHANLLDRITRSGILASDVLNFKDLFGVFSKDADKLDLFNSQADHTCWLSKYASMVTTDNGQYGVSLFFKDYEQELNQFISQINYSMRLTTPKNISQLYFDFPFKVVTINFTVSNNIADSMDESEFSIPSGASNAIMNEAKARYIEHVVKNGFPYCFYRTDFEDTYSEAGGHNLSLMRPHEKFNFTVYPSGLREFKAWFFSTYRYIDEVNTAIYNAWNRYFNYFDFLNIPYGFDNGERQVMILKDPEQGSPIYKENPLNRVRETAHIIVEGYIVVPYEIYATSDGVNAVSGEMPIYPTLEKKDPTLWRNPSYVEPGNDVIQPTIDVTTYDPRFNPPDDSGPGILPIYITFTITDPIDVSPTPGTIYIGPDGSIYVVYLVFLTGSPGDLTGEIVVYKLNDTPIPSNVPGTLTKDTGTGDNIVDYASLVVGY